ncbi:stannin isoform X3 [Hypanus sabinus]|uniref:stannin isoform X3 n=1 Tax=Hypanus sabinus TaxID=79690 RepID=UPI0028C4C166|nr:stannin isoform X3 [Hypanus sabinus]
MVPRPGVLFALGRSDWAAPNVSHRGERTAPGRRLDAQLSRKSAAAFLPHGGPGSSAKIGQEYGDDAGEFSPASSKRCGNPGLSCELTGDSSESAEMAATQQVPNRTH